MYNPLLIILNRRFPFPRRERHGTMVTATALCAYYTGRLRRSRHRSRAPPFEVLRQLAPAASFGWTPCPVLPPASSLPPARGCANSLCLLARYGSPAVMCTCHRHHLPLLPSAPAAPRSKTLSRCTPQLVLSSNLAQVSKHSLWFLQVPLPYIREAGHCRTIDDTVIACP